jgi:ABC-type multidrug transport system ATPase subunit
MKTEVTIERCPGQIGEEVTIVTATPTSGSIQEAEEHSHGITINYVMKRFNTNLALDCCSLRVEQGEVIGLLGPNGAGKTTCIRAIIGLIGIDEGSITVFGMPQDGKNKAIRRKIGYVTQEITLYEDMSGRDNLPSCLLYENEQGRYSSTRLKSQAHRP